MKKLILFIIVLLQAGHLLCQTGKLDLKGLKKEEFRDSDGTVIAKYYDKRDSLLYEINYDAQGRIINGSFGIAIDKHQYNESGDRIETRYYDKDMKPVRNEGGPAIIKRKYDGNHRMLEEGFYYENGKLVKSDFSVIQYKYDDKGRLVEEIQLNEERLPSGDNPIKKYKNDQKGRRIEESLFDKNNTFIKTGADFEYTTVKFEYDAYNRIIKKMFYSEKDMLIEGKAILKIAYDKRPPTRTSIDAMEENPKWLELTYFDKHGKELETEYQYIPKSER